MNMVSHIANLPLSKPISPGSLAIIVDTHAIRACRWMHIYDILAWVMINLYTPGCADDYD